MLWESNVWDECGIHWETHTLCKRHAYSLCDAHGGGIKRAIRAACVEGNHALTACDFAELINNMSLIDDKFARAKAYAFNNIPREDKTTLMATLRTMNGMQKACEFQYNEKCRDGVYRQAAGVVRFRHCSGHPSESYQTFSIIKRNKQLCTQCIAIKERVVY
jgi:hypothetical protein